MSGILGAELMRALLEGDGDALPCVGERLGRLLKDRNPFVRLRTEALLLGMAYGNSPRGLLGVTVPAPPVTAAPRYVLIEAKLAQELNLAGAPLDGEEPDLDDDELEAVT